MEYSTALLIISIMFWVLLALGIVCLLAWMFVHINYFMWDKEDRMKNNIVAEVQETIKQKADDIESDSGGNLT